MMTQLIAILVLNIKGW